MILNYARDLDKKIFLINYIFTFSVSIIIWKVILQIVIALTTTKAEYITIMKTVKEAIWLQALIVILDRLQRRLYGFITKNVIHLINNYSWEHEVYWSKTLFRSNKSIKKDYWCEESMYNMIIRQMWSRQSW